MMIRFSVGVVVVGSWAIGLGAWGAEVFVAPGGDDRWSGTLAEANAARTDGPFLTLERARDAARQIRRQRGEGEPIVVKLRGGVYPRTVPLTLTAEDSGSVAGPLTWQSYPGERAVLSGGKTLTGWKPGPDGLWTVEVPEVKAGKWYFRQLFLNGQRRARAKLPKQGILQLAGGPPADTRSWMGAPPAGESDWGLRAFQFRPGDIRKDWRNLADVEVVVLQFWMEARLRIQSIHAEKNTVAMTGGSWRPLTWSGGYYVENVAEGLHAAGAWYLDRTQGVLYYRPLPGEEMGKIEAVAPAIEQLLRLEGDAPAGRAVRHVTFRNLEFAHTDWTLPPQGYMYSQAELPAPTAVHADGAVSCRIEQCRFNHLGAWAIALCRGCRDNALAANLFRDCGAGAIKIGEAENAAEDLQETCRTMICDNRVLDCGHVFLGSPGIWIGQSSGNTVSHNEISGPLMWAISVGWTWSYYPLQRARDNVVEFNHCHHIGTGTLGSHCAIYALGTSPGTVIRNNYVHHVLASSFWPGASEGIILDNGCVGILVENNVVHDAAAGGFGTNFNCFGNIIVNNIFAYGTQYQLTVYGDQPTGKPQPKGEIFARNIVIWKEGPLIKEDDWPNFSTLWDYNVYWQDDGKPVTFMKYSLDQWRSKDLDVHSLVADPRFVDAKARNFALQPDSPAMKVGFRPIDLRTVGPRQ